MVKIIRGVYGYCGDNGIIIPKTSKDKPFSLSPEDEKRLVDKKVAVYVDDEAETPKEVDAAEESEETGTKEEPKNSKKQGSKKSKGKKPNNKKDTVDEEPPAFDAVDPE